VERPGVVVLHDPVQAVAAARRPGCLAGDAAAGLRLAVAELRPDLVPGALHRGAGAAVGGVLATWPVPVEGEAAPGRVGCPGDGVAVGQQVPGDTAHLGGVPARVVPGAGDGYLALVVLLPCGALGEGEGLLAVQARPGECRERGVAGALVGGVQVFGRGVRRLAGGAPLLVGRAVGGPQVLVC
jgi:hypothetical protein